jgi:hypothetical protein
LTNPEQKAYNYSDENVFKNVINGQTIDIGLYPNDVQLYSKYLKELRQVLKFRPEFSNFAWSKLRKVRQRYWTQRKGSYDELVYVGVHVRRKDYKWHLSDLYNRTFVSKDYFFSAMDFYRKNFLVS